MRIDSRAVHAGRDLEAGTAQAPAISPTSTWIFDDLDEYERVASGAQTGHLYARESGENVAMLEAAMADLEGAEAAVATASGMAALLATLLALAPRPAPIAIDRHCYGVSLALLRRDLEPLGYEVRVVEASDAGALESALPGAAMLLVETISNPLCQVADIPGLARACERHRAHLVVDGTFATPYLNRPLEHGASVVLHSVTKYLGGHSDLIAGVVSGPQGLMSEVRSRRSRLGSSLGSFEAWLALRGLRTLPVRMARHSQNALQLARALDGMGVVRRVYHPGLPSSPDHDLVRAMLPQGTGGMLALDLAGGRSALQAALDRFQMVRFAASLGGVETTVSYPALTSHRALSEEERLRVGVSADTVRVSVGLEDALDLIADFQQALEAS
ncbi:MAG: trans-sulfuration enzyme family protein [Candidatus Dormibacteraceae bacterium]